MFFELKRSVQSKDRQNAAQCKQKLMIINANPSSRLNAPNPFDFIATRATRLTRTLRALAVLLAIGILSHEARDTIRILNGIGRIAESEGRTAASLRVVDRPEEVEAR